MGGKFETRVKVLGRNDDETKQLAQSGEHFILITAFLNGEGGQMSGAQVHYYNVYINGIENGLKVGRKIL